MSRWKNFSIWRGKLPHWRADDVVYYVTFRYRRELQPSERGVLFAKLFQLQGRKIDLVFLRVGLENSELCFKVGSGANGAPLELSDIIERAKIKSGKEIIKKSGERFPPFYAESLDRIVRDEAELEEKFMAALELGTATEEEELYFWASDMPD